MAKDNLEFFIYQHSDRDWNPAKDQEKGKLGELIGSDPNEISKRLDLEDIDALLVLDEGGGRWFLVYAGSLGIVGQRTARRQADTIARSGYRMPAGYTIKGNYPLDEMSDTNIGDLWKTVQQKYVKSNLSGMALDEETGLPSQLVERAQRLEEVGEKDELADPTLEKEEAERRRLAMVRSQSGDQGISAESATAPQKKKKPTKKKPAKKVLKKATQKAAKSASKPAKKPAKTESTSAVTTGEAAFMEIETVKHNVIDGFTQAVAKGKVSVGTEDPVEMTIVFDQAHLNQKEWTEIGLFLKDNDVVQITITTENDVEFATSVKI